MGRLVAGYVDAEWARVRRAVVTCGSLHKFMQHEGCRTWLMSTRGLSIAEASQTDDVWGIGISVAQAYAGVAHRGSNLLGRVLMRARESLAGRVYVFPAQLPAWFFTPAAIEE
jgi:ribA/ribD-fused uncharacterized protein